MSSKLLFLVCAQLLVQSISAQCIGAIGAPMLAAPMTTPCAGSLGAPFATEWAYAPVASLAASNGPGMAISSASPILPAGVSVLSNNEFGGILAAGGATPFLGTVAIEGALPTAGAGTISYGCGNGAVAVTAEDFGAMGFDAMTSTLFAAPFTMAIGPMAAAPLAAELNPWDDANVAVATLAASNGPGVAVSTASPLAPAGVAVLSDNAYEGALAAGGALPFLGTVAIEGALPTAGAGAVAYGCGNGAVGITAEDRRAMGFPGTLGYGIGLAGPIGVTGPPCGLGYMY